MVAFKNKCPASQLSWKKYPGTTKARLEDFYFFEQKKIPAVTQLKKKIRAETTSPSSLSEGNGSPQRNFWIVCGDKSN